MSLCDTLALVGLLTVTLAAQTQPASQPASTEKPARAPGLYATFQTTMGVIVAQLFEHEAPITVRNFIALQKGRKPWKDQQTGQMVRRPLYTGTIFHRVIPNFMIQGGDPAGNGMGNPGFTIQDEFNLNLKFDRVGRLAMANVGQPNTGGCQFFITVAQTTWLNGKHTIFGQVVEGQNVVDAISKVKARSPGAEDRPITPIRITALTFERVGPAPVNDPLGPPPPPAAKKAPGAKPSNPHPAAGK
jgi:peptidyl-prolyl cis-trans isomerase A (cyclophilin A)